MTDKDKKILTDFHNKRKLFDAYIKDRGLKLYTCPGCGYPTLNERGGFGICIVCNWEDAHRDENEPDKARGGPNGNLSLTENRINIGRVLLDHARSVQANIKLNPSYVFPTLEMYKKKRNAIGQRMTGDEKPDDQLWVEWGQVRKDVQMALANSSNDHPRS